jgi:hypothetical protein
MVDAAKMGDDLVAGFELWVFRLRSSMKESKRLQRHARGSGIQNPH